MDEQDRLAEIRARAEAARQAAASGTTGTPPNIDGLSVNDALDIFHESAEDVPWLLDEVKRLRADRDAQGRFVSVVAEFARTTAMTHGAVMDAVGLKADRDRLAATVERVRALAEAGEDEPHNGHASFEGEPECPACWVASIEAALKEGDES